MHAGSYQHKSIFEEHHGKDTSKALHSDISGAKSQVAYGGYLYFLNREPPRPVPYSRANNASCLFDAQCPAFFWIKIEGTSILPVFSITEPHQQ